MADVEAETAKMIANLEAKTGRKVVTGENFLPPGKARKALDE